VAVTLSGKLLDRFLREAEEGPTHLGLRSLRAEFAANPLDLRGRQATHPDLYDPDPARYAAAQAWAALERARGVDGVLYNSVRRAAGECVAVLRPRCVVACLDGERIIYEWDGRRFTRTFRGTTDHARLEPAGNHRTALAGRAGFH
jgi:hypothetical protein